MRSCDFLSLSSACLDSAVSSADGLATWSAGGWLGTSTSPNSDDDCLRLSAFSYCRSTMDSIMDVMSDRHSDIWSSDVSIALTSGFVKPQLKLCASSDCELSNIDPDEMSQSCASTCHLSYQLSSSSIDLRFEFKPFPDT